MTAIQDSPCPLVFKLGNAKAVGLGLPSSTGRVDIRTRVRSLEGMQKEVILHYGPTGTAWRMVCDEGAGLHGTDLAPFPLAFFNVGSLDSIAAEIEAVASARGLSVDGLELTLLNRYTREGSATAGTMTGGALPAELDVTPPTGADLAIWSEIARHALAASPADAMMRTALANTFTITKNGAPLPPGRVAALHKPAIGAGDALFDAATPAAPGAFAEDIIVKLQGPDAELSRANAGSSMRETQRRELGVLGRLTLRSDGMRETRVRIAREGLSSTWRFLSENAAPFGGRERAPDGLAYVSAGIALCFMTQVGRHAHTVKNKLWHYAVTQVTSFSLPGASGGTNREATAAPVESHAHLTIDEDDDTARTLIDMGEKSCFLHGACSGSFKTKLRIAQPAERREAVGG